MRARDEELPEKGVRSERTRERILLQARRIFAELGYEKTTIRTVAAAATIHPSMVMRYFRSKEELFATAALVNFNMPDLRAVDPGRRGAALVAHVMEQWESESTGRELQVLLRAAGTHDMARRRFVEIVQQQALPAIRQVVVAERAEERIGFVVTQIAGLVVSRYLFAYGPVVAMSREQVVRTIGPVLQGYMTGPLP